MKKILLKNGKPLIQGGKVILSSGGNSGSDEPGTAYEDLLEIIGTKANSADVYTKTETDSKLEEIKEETSSYSKSFTGTFAEYETASANGLIPDGMIVYILDDDDEVIDEPVVDDRTSSLLGTGVLGYMILG